MTAMRFIASAALAAGLLAPAEAQQVRRAETGTVGLVHFAMEGLDAPVTLSSGDTIWTETIRPVRTARLLGDALERNQPDHVDPVPAGTLLFGVDLRGGVAFCERIDFDAPVSRVQCFRDFDNDGDFDGGYMTRGRSLDSQYITAYVRGLAAIPPLPYEPIQPSADYDAPAHVTFEGMRRGYPRFRQYIEDERMDDRENCAPVEGVSNECVVWGVRLRFEEVEGRTYRFTLVSAPPYRRTGVTVQGTGL